MGFFLQIVQDCLGFSVVFLEEFLLLTLDDQNLCMVFAEGGKVLLGDNKCQSSKLRLVLWVQQHKVRPVLLLETSQ